MGCSRGDSCPHGAARDGGARRRRGTRTHARALGRSRAHASLAGARATRYAARSSGTNHLVARGRGPGRDWSTSISRCNRPIPIRPRVPRFSKEFPRVVRARRHNTHAVRRRHVRHGASRAREHSRRGARSASVTSLARDASRTRRCARGIDAPSTLEGSIARSIAGDLARGFGAHASARWAMRRAR